MKNKIFAACLLITLSGCIKDVLDRKPLNIITDDDVWESKELVDIYLANLYDAIPIGFLNRVDQSNFTDESSFMDGTYVSGYGNQWLSLNTGMYEWIRNVNYFLGRIGTSSLSEEDIRTLSAEGHFIRAYYYFDLVRKYGGMPLIKTVQNFDNNLEDIQIPRSKEEEVWEFIASELDSAILDLPETQEAAGANRPTKYTALALKSRAMLYAGSIAKYGQVQLGGILGIPSDKAESYFTASLDASQKIIDSKHFSLYTKQYDPATHAGDPVANYQNIFLDENNSEIIFQKAYSFPDKAHSYDNWNIPEGFTTNNGSSIAPTLEMVESYEYIDGSPGDLKTDKEYDSPTGIFEGKDPRFEASVLHGGSPTGWGRDVQIYRGIYAGGKLYESLSPFPEEPSRRQVGLDGPFSSGNFGKTGFYIKKYMNIANRVVEPGYSDQNYIDIRYAEILLNAAEAAVELGRDKTGALDAINQIRGRAGIKLLTAGELTLDKIRHERKIELAFEDKRFWDIRRWRLGTNLFRNTYVHGLWPYLNYENGKYTYTYKVVNGYPIDDGYPRIFEQRDYYSNLSAYVNSNPKIVNNPGW
ncbi:RagB/SusD family nutrient uptake outer membrane protein [Compostibacter hankyongensis]|uniref:RagB/SusD family nutrient uptake outer membrane protein n=1 Tax=Compostibacter hankyongensis TaxID=1007089 RepID=A0ABP8FE50_9BACT